MDLQQRMLVSGGMNGGACQTKPAFAVRLVASEEEDQANETTGDVRTTPFRQMVCDP